MTDQTPSSRASENPLFIAPDDAAVHAAAALSGTTNPVVIPPPRAMSSLKRLQDPVKFQKAWKAWTNK